MKSVIKSGGVAGTRNENKGTEKNTQTDGKESSYRFACTASMAKMLHAQVSFSQSSARKRYAQRHRGDTAVEKQSCTHRSKDRETAGAHKMEKIMEKTEFMTHDLQTDNGETQNE